MSFMGQANSGVNGKLITSYFRGQAGRLKNNRQASAFNNLLEASIEMDYAAQVFCSRFSWEGDEIKDYPIGYIERSLFYSGFCVGFMSEKYGFLVLPATASSFSILGEPANVLAQGYSETFDLAPGEYAILKDTNTYSCPAQVADRKSALVADCTRTIETYLLGMKKPVMMVTNDKNKLTNQKIMEEIVHNTPYILASQGKSGAAPEDEPPIFHNSPHNGGDLIALIQTKRALTNDMLGKIGVDCNGSGKSQYQSEDELEKETFFTNMINKQGHENRLYFVDKVKEMFDITLTVTNNVVEAQRQDDGGDGEMENEDA